MSSVNRLVVNLEIGRENWTFLWTELNLAVGRERVNRN
jgi:hypothetical protein